MMLPNLGPWEWAIILVIVIIIFGVGRLPEVGGALGKAIREFRASASMEDKSASSKSQEQAVKTSSGASAEEEKHA